CARHVAYYGSSYVDYW
nr:immunoglobulin heavy chain junction region [Mus musculus]